jgi:hypothetical protein
MGTASARRFGRPRSVDGRRIIWLDDIVVPDRRWFGFTIEGELRFVGAAISFGGEVVPPNKFITIRTGGTHDFAFYGLGLAHWAIGRYGSSGFTQVLGALPRKARQPDARRRVQRDGLEGGKAGSSSAALISIGRTRPCRPQGHARQDQVHGSAARRRRLVVQGFRDRAKRGPHADRPRTAGTSKATPQGVGGKQAEVHEDVKAEIVKADSDLISDGINNTLAMGHALELRRGRQAADGLSRPRRREDLDTVAERDSSSTRSGSSGRTSRSSKSMARAIAASPSRTPSRQLPARPVAAASPGRRTTGRPRRRARAAAPRSPRPIRSRCSSGANS